MNVKAKLEALESRQRQIIFMRMQGLSQREIARLMGRTDCQVCREIKRIRRQLDRNN